MYTCINSFKQLYGKLRELKSEIEHIQHLHEKAKMQVQRHFEQWWDEQTGQDKVTKLYVEIDVHYFYSSRFIFSV